MLVVSDLKVPESSLENDIVDCASFWNNVEYEMLGKSFCEGNLMGAMVAGFFSVYFTCRQQQSICC